ncbi:carbohydrate ABC transporter substrate-binding protein, CUT1 family [Rathayibacter oskolensis]|uniref:Carbohydrate ABC transporter substrate-binding protein, CUT1 family n=1 Tax=Rathayibacter oskolensis TaxID=1891671 RepID=A0A1X7NXU1_9MICO|nr:extracellular solute-binding protein [Rathayibacter oskolensis]SMH42336.1 carbohydrate ABC transporter substrate-binding protein, CUT1 family [Rathayibacter oskolensis]
MSEQRRFPVRRSAYLALPAVAAVLLAGCSGSPSGESSDGSTSFSLTYAKSNTIASPFEILAQDYMDSHEGVEITLSPQPNDTYGDAIRTQLQAGNAPDVMETEAGSGQSRSVIPLAEAGFLEPIPDAADVIPPGSESSYTFDDAIYGLPLGVSYAGLILNQTATDAAGLSTFPTDLDSLEAACATAADAGKSMFVVAGGAAPNAGITALVISATRVFAETPDWNEQRAAGEVTFADSDGWKDTLQTVLDLEEAGCFQAGVEGAGFDAITNNMTSGASLSFFGPLGSASELAKAAPDQTFVAQAFPPASEGDKPYGVASPTYSLSINAKSANKEAASEFLDWLAAPEQSTAFADASGGLPVAGLADMDFTGGTYEGVSDLLKNGDYTPLPNQAWANASVYDAMATGVQGLLTGQSTIDQVLSSMDAAWD